MERDGTEVLSLEELSKMQDELLEQRGKLYAEVRRRAAAEKVPPEEIWIQLMLYRRKLQSTDDPKLRVPTPVKALVTEVMEDIRQRSK